MFKKKTIVWGACLSCIALGMGRYLTVSSPEDVGEYHALLKASNMHQKQPQEHSYTVKQQRHKLQKHIFYSKGDERLRIKLCCEGSQILLDHQNDVTEIVEHLQDVEGYMQEELYYVLADGREVIRSKDGILTMRHGNHSQAIAHSGELVPMQIVRHFKADRASYFYTTERLIAENAYVSRYVLPGHQVIDAVENFKPIMAAFAISSEFSLKENEVPVQRCDQCGLGTVALMGEAIIQHDIGKISADNVALAQVAEEQHKHVPVINMQGNVSIHFKEGGKLSCSSAKLNYSTLSGFFSGGEYSPFVNYSSFIRKVDGSMVPLTIQSRKMTVSFLEKQNSTLHPIAISDIIAEEDVVISYCHDFQAMADRAIYQTARKEDLLHPKEDLEGVIHLKANGEQGQCCVFNEEGDRIHASEIHINTPARTLAFIYPKGHIHTQGEEKKIEAIDFSADTMTWDKENNILTLREHVYVHQEGFGMLASEGEIALFWMTSRGRKELQKIQTQGKTILACEEAEVGIERTLTTYGQCEVDHVVNRVKIVSPLDGKGTVLPGQQVHLQDRMGSILADKVTMEYILQGQKVIPQRFILEGHVHIRNQFAAPQGGEARPLMQYALADVVEYVPGSEQMNLLSRGNSRVLFFDKVNNIQVSAPILKVRRDPHTKKESIQGQGDVRFTFVERELEQLREHFKLD